MYSFFYLFIDKDTADLNLHEAKMPEVPEADPAGLVSVFGCVLHGLRVQGVYIYIHNRYIIM